MDLPHLPVLDMKIEIDLPHVILTHLFTSIFRRPRTIQPTMIEAKMEAVTVRCCRPRGV